MLGMALNTPARLAGLVLAILAALGCVDTPYPEVKVDLRGQPPAPPAVAPSGPVLRVSVAAMQSPADTYASYSRFLGRMGALLGDQVQFVQRRTYGEVNDLLLSGQLDAALVCTGGFLELESRRPGAVEVLAVPVIGGKTTYHSDLIVPAASQARSLADLAGRRFAFTDDLSLSGYLYVASQLRERGLDHGRFFASAIFTRSHDRSIEAVAKGLVDGASVDSLVLESLLARDPGLAARVRVIHRSPPFGVMPVVAPVTLPVETRRKLGAVLLELHLDPEAAKALQAVGIERFVAPPPGHYSDAARVTELAR